MNPLYMLTGVAGFLTTKGEWLFQELIEAHNAQAWLDWTELELTLHHEYTIWNDRPFPVTCNSRDLKPHVMVFTELDAFLNRLHSGRRFPDHLVRRQG